MKVIKKWKMFNESSEINCDFDTFKDIMSEIADNYKHEFYNYEGSGDNFYDLVIELPELSNIDDINLNWKYLEEIISPYDDPYPYEEIFKRDGGKKNIIDVIDDELESYTEILNQLESMKSKTNKLKSLFTTLEKEIIPRLSYFKNFSQCSIGFDSSVLRICFDMPGDE